MKTKYTTYASFHIDIFQNESEKFLKPEIWPSGWVLARFFGKLKPDQIYIDSNQEEISSGNQEIWLRTGICADSKSSTILLKSSDDIADDFEMFEGIGSVDGQKFGFNEVSRFRVIHLNIRSLRKNFDNFIALLGTLRISFDIIILTDIWIYTHEVVFYEIED